MAVYGKDKHPLEYFEGKSREDILAVTGVGPKTYAKIHRALFWRSVKRFFTSPFLAFMAGWKALKREWIRNRPRRVPRKRKARNKRAIPKFIAWVLVALVVLGLLWFVLCFLVQLFNQPATTPVQTVASPTPTPTQVSVGTVVTGEVTEEVPIMAEGLVHLLVEIFEIHPQYVQYGILRPLDNVEVVVSTNRNGKPLDGERKALIESRSGIDVALWEGDVPSGSWVTINPPDGCSIWELDSNWNGWYFVPFEYVGTDYLAKFQVICGQDVVEPSPTVVETSPPQETPTSPPGPTGTPEPTSTPVPTDPPPTEVTCPGCEDDPPKTQVPTPTPMEATSTPVR